MAKPVFPSSSSPWLASSAPNSRPWTNCTWIDEDYNYQFVVKPQYQERIVQAKQRCLRTKNWKLVCTPTAAGTRHYGLFHIATDPHGETDLAASRPEVLAPLRAALDRWMDQKIETSIAEIFPGGEP